MGNGAEVVMIEDKTEEATSSLDWCTANVEATKKKEVVEISGKSYAALFFLSYDHMRKYYDCMGEFFIY